MSRIPLFGRLFAPSGCAGAAALLVALQGTGAVSGRLLDGTGRVLPDVPLALVASATAQRYETRTDDGGRFTVSGLPRGDYQIQIAKPGFADVAGRILLAAGQQTMRDVVPRIASLRQAYNVPLKRDGAASSLERKVLRLTPPDDPCSSSTSGGCVTPPTRMVEAWPLYPRSRADKGISGVVEVNARLGSDGFLYDLRASDDADPEFAAAAVEALRVWEYSPLRLNGIPQEGNITVTFRFNAGTN